MLTRIIGKVIKGDGYGRKLGFPTANLDRRQYVRENIKVMLGVWAGTASILNSKYKILNTKPAAIVIGPLDKKGLPKIEAHLLNFKGDLYGKKISIVLKKYLRPFKKYKSEEGLVKQIKIDVQKVKKIII